MVDFYGFHVGKHTNPMDSMGYDIGSCPLTISTPLGEPAALIQQDPLLSGGPELTTIKGVG